MLMMCLKCRIKVLIINIISLCQILLSHISNDVTHTLVIITHYKCVGYVIIPKPNYSGRESINCCCRRFGSICRRYDLSCRRSDRDTSMAIDRDHNYHPFLTARWFIQQNTRAVTRFRDSFWVFFAYKIKKLLGRTEMRTNERKDLQSIRTL